MIKGVIFDLDNTLEEWTRFEDFAQRELAQELSARHGFDVDSFLKVFDAIKVGYLHQRAQPRDFGRDVWFSEALAHFDIDDEDIDAIVERYWSLLNNHVKLFPGALELLEELTGRFRLGLLTDGDGADTWMKTDRIKHLGIERFFHVILLSNDIGVNKPHPRCFVEMARQLGVGLDECMMVGDKPEVDLIMAKQLGMMTVWTRQGGKLPEVEGGSYSYVDHVIDHISEVRDLLATPAKVRHPSAQ